MLNKLNTIHSCRDDMMFVPNDTMLGARIYDKKFIAHEDWGMCIHDIVIPPASTCTWNGDENFVFYLLTGTVLVNGEIVEAEATVVCPAGMTTTILVDARSSAHMIALVHPAVTALDGPIIRRESDLLWLPLIEDGEQHFILQDVLTPDEVGFHIQVLDYPPKYTTVWHIHHCSHAIYVLDGMLKTHEGYYGPGSFIWGPEGQKMEHGATDDTNAVVLFITDKPFDLIYLSEDEIPV